LRFFRRIHEFSDCFPVIVRQQPRPHSVNVILNCRTSDLLVFARFRALFPLRAFTCEMIRFDGLAREHFTFRDLTTSKSSSRNRGPKDWAPGRGEAEKSGAKQRKAERIGSKRSQSHLGGANRSSVIRK
jgi:hypothetical protein